MSILHRMLSVLRRRDRVYDAYVAGVKAGHEVGHADGCQDGLSVGYDRGWLAYDNDAVCQRIRNRNLTEAYTNGHSDGCQDGLIIGEKIGYLRREGRIWSEIPDAPTQYPIDLETCALCNRPMPPIDTAIDDGWCPSWYDADDDECDGPVCPICAKTHNTNQDTPRPTQYPTDPLAPPTRQDSADDAIATITDLMRHGG